MRDSRRNRLLLSVVLIVALGLVAADYTNGASPVIRTARSVAGSVFGGAERVVSGVIAPVARLFGSSQGSSAGRTTALERQVATLRAELSAASLDKSQYRQLSQVLRVARAGSYRVVAGTVIGFGQGYQQTVTVDAGSAQGVRPQQTVLTGGGLVGQVISVTAHTCTVLLADDPGSTVGIRMAPSGEIGWVTGQGPAGTGRGLLKLSVLNPAVPLRPGQQLVTAASVNDRPFVPGVPVGVVVTVLSQAGSLTGQALVRPDANFSALDVVGIVVGPPRHNPKYKVLPVAAQTGR